MNHRIEVHKHKVRQSTHQELSKDHCTLNLRMTSAVCLLVAVSLLEASSAVEDVWKAVNMENAPGLLQQDMHDGPVRSRRQAFGHGVRGYNETQKKIMLDKHNFYRRQPKASDMRLMEWNDKLEQLAQDWADGCNFEHRSDETAGRPTGFRYNGENLYAATHSYDPLDVGQGWYESEINFYNYDTLQCTKVCGHYTQIVWATSYALGCGVTYCSNLKSTSFSKGYLVVCNYGPGGNVGGQKPYKRGSDPCTECPDEAPYCVDGLCAREPMIIGACSGHGYRWITLYGPVLLGLLAGRRTF